MFIDSAVVTPFPPKSQCLRQCWVGLPCLVGKLRQEKELLCLERKGQSWGVLELFPSSATSRAYHPLTVGRWNSDIRDNWANYPQLTWVHSHVGGYFFFFFCPARCEGWVFPRLFRSCGMQLSDALTRMKYGCSRGCLGSFGSLCMHIYANPACCACSLHV